MKSPRLVIGSIVAFALMVVFGVLQLGFFAHRGEKNAFSPEAIAALEAPDSFYLYSLHPVPADFRRQTFGFSSGNTNETPKIEMFHGFEVLGRAEIVDTNERKELVEALKNGVAEGKKLEPLACFDPRHGIRAVKGGTNVDLVICFECLTIMEVINTDRWFRISHKPNERFNEALKRANLPLASE